MRLKHWSLADLTARIGRDDFIVSGPSCVIREISALAALESRTDRTHIIMQSSPLPKKAPGFRRVVVEPYNATNADIVLAQPTTEELASLTLIPTHKE